MGRKEDSRGKKRRRRRRSYFKSSIEGVSRVIG